LRYYPKGSYVITLAGIQGCDYRGNVTFPRSLKSYPFSTTGEMVRIIQEDIRRNNFPQNAFEQRLWDKDGKRTRTVHLPPQEDAEEQDGIATFLVQVRYYQNATWQGLIQWLERKQTERFRSVLELLALIEEAFVIEQERLWENLQDG
jgi:hypothetical protein